MIPRDQLHRFVPADRAPQMGTVPSEVRGTTKEFLHPGQMCVSSEPCTVTTIVGSCVVVCLWDPILRIGGVTHYILAQWDRRGSRHRDTATSQLSCSLAKWWSSAAHREQIAGARIRRGLHVRVVARARTVLSSRMNVEIALELLGEI